MPPHSILVIDDDSAMTELAEFHLASRGYAVTVADTGEKALQVAESKSFSVVLTDMMLPDLDGIEVVRQFKTLYPETEIIMITGYSSVTTAIEATKAGAFHFVEKPVQFEEVLLLIEKAIERREQAREINRLRNQLRSRDSYFDIIGGSKAMQAIYEMIDCVAESDANVLVIGESGTGKEMVANAIHYRSLRAAKSFVKVNCAALPKELIESELFGHAKGAFTGAAQEKSGFIGQANGGSLLMDEIGEMPLELQPKLLRVLQERVYYRIGDDKPREANFRLISATNRSPLEAIEQGLLREDLYYRINTIEVHVPPLRERSDDVQRLAEYFLAHFAKKYNRPANRLSRESYEKLFEHSWPGNVRELQNTMERAVLMTPGEVIEAHIISNRFERQPPRVVLPTPAPVEEISETPERVVIAPAVVSETGSSFESLIEELVARIPAPDGDTPSPDFFESIEAFVVKAALNRTGGNKQAAANLLGVYRPRLYSMMKKHQVQFTPAEKEKVE